MSSGFIDLGDGLEVRRLEPGDAEELFALVDPQRDRLRIWLPWPDETEAPRDIRGFIERQRSGNGLEALGICVDGTLVGGIGLSVDEEHNNGELGYWVSSTHEGQGLVTRCCRALVDHAFDVIGLHRVVITVAPDNARSRAIPERLGFKQEGLAREAGRSGTGYHDLLIYSVLENEWSR
jgi:ribosomal-protein-serine acetyltransferase